MTVLLQVRNLHKRFESGGGLLGGRKQIVHAVNGVSFDVHRGQSVGLVGESGCGKPTVARMLLRLVEADEGSIVFDSLDLLKASPKQMHKIRERIQIVFQDPFSSLNPKQTIRQVLTEPLRVHHAGTAQEIASKVVRILDEVGLSQSTLNRYPHEFSGGQRQRIGIARALILDPELIVADEPVSALDVSVQAQILQLLGRLQRERHLSFLFVSHDLAVIRHFCDEVCVMYLGSIVEHGNTAQVLDSPLHPYSRTLRDSSLIPDPTQRIALHKIIGEIPSATNLPSGCTFHPRCPVAQADCRVNTPLLKMIAPGRDVACFHPLLQDQAQHK